MNISHEINNLSAEGLLRELRRQPASGGKFERDGKLILNFSSNDYLNLANDPRLKEAAIRATEKYGCGGTASRLMSGNLDLHEALEAALANLMQTDAALLFGSGFLANLGLLSALAERGDAIFADKLNHASLIDGARLSGARVFRYRHADAAHLEELLTKNSKFRRRVIVTDSVFSMDGDLAPIKSIADMAKNHDALLAVDEAHAVGILGNTGSGICATLPDRLRPDLVIATLGKSLGGYGGFVACSEEMKQFLINRARTFIYSTSLPPAVAAAALRAVEIVQSEVSLGPRLMDRVHFFNNRLNELGATQYSLQPATSPHLKFPISNFQLFPEAPASNIQGASRHIPQSPILPILVGDNQKSITLMQNLMKENLLAVAVRPPTVPAGTARLRLSVTLAHDEADLSHAAELIAEALREIGNA